MLIVVDGSMGEGGGQILRTSLALSAILGKPVKIINIRAKRRNPGLQRQHMVSVKAVASLANAEVEGLRLGSTEIVFRPRELRGGKFVFDIGTAGSVTLVFQAIMPILFFIRERVVITIRGGTDVPWSPPIDYVRFVVAKHLENLGLSISIALRRRGHYPRGGGEVVVEAKGPGYIPGFYLVERGDIRLIEGLSHCVRLPSHVAIRQAESATRLIRKALPNVPVSISTEYYEKTRDPHLGPGSGIVVWARTEKSILGGDALGARGKKAEVVGEEAAQKLIEDLGTGKAFDRHMSDMIIPLAALADGDTAIGGAMLTNHAYTNIMLVERIIDKVKVVLREGGSIGKPFIAEIKKL